MNKSEIFEPIPCPICNTKDTELISQKGQFGLPCFVSICPFDGLVFLSPRWSKERYVRFYENEFYTYYRPADLSDKITDSHYNSIKKICGRLEQLNLLKGKESVLDIGAGMGWSLQWLKQHYAHFKRFSAIESSVRCIANLKTVIGANVVSHDVDSQWTSTGFDLVIMRHVLEHFMHPVEALKKVWENLSPHGIIYIAVPDMMNPKGSLKHSWFSSAHTFYFSLMTLTSIASMAHLSPIEIMSENSELWGVFTKASNKTKRINIINVYDKQMEIIKLHQRKDIIFNAYYTIKNVLLPKKIRSWLKNQYRRIIA
jgi:2-polyprenyl-3-methyl-5-hydroxy-6-metoxy-1,4-benzoquinol methylase